VRGFCTPCVVARQSETIRAMRDESGPEYARWVRRSYMEARRRLLALEQKAV
jgi:hypothetical protein